ncbi:hypothetical protein HYW41_01390 [Candidatus Daviesbacteria bacterium]|nr:hypothetical protein [Candidatus Daviesbacteria bacterium]
MVKGIIAGIILGAAVLGAIFYFSPDRFIQSAKQTSPATPVPTSTTTPTNILFDSQTATINAQITQVSSSSLTFSKNNQTETLPLSPKVLIYKPKTDKSKPNSQAATSSADLKSIEVGKTAVIVAEMINNQYQVISISYLSNK